MPQAAAVVAAIVGALIEAGVDADGISVLQPPAGAGPAEENPCRLLPAAIGRRVALVVHNPADRRQLAYLAADDAGEAILIHRALHEADLILPVGCLRAPAAAGYFGIHTALYPAFSDEKTLRRFRGLDALGGGGRKKQLSARVDHVGWLLGINLTVQVVPAAGEEVMHVLAGRNDSVRRRGRELYHAAWDWPARPGQPGDCRHRRPRRADLGERGPGTPRGPALRRRRRRDRDLLRAGSPAGPRPAAACRPRRPRRGPRCHTAARGPARARSTP